MRVISTSAGKWKIPISAADRNASTDRLSMTSARNPLSSPAEFQRREGDGCDISAEDTSMAGSRDDSRDAQD
jgi:hypothetical protein